MSRVTVSSYPARVTLHCGQNKVTLRYAQKGERGIGISNVALDDQAHLIVTYDDGKTQDAGAALGDVASVKDGIDSSYKKVQTSEANVTKLEASTKANADKAQQALQDTQSASTSGVDTINTLVFEKMTYMTSTFNSLLTQAKANIDQLERDAEDKMHRVRTYSLEQIKTAHDDAMVDIERSVNKAEAWAVSETTPDKEPDFESPTGLAQSSRSWALLSKKKAQEATDTLNVVKDNETNVSNMKNDVAELLRKTQTSEQNTHNYMNDASASQKAAKESENTAETYMENAKTSEVNAKASETASSDSASKAHTSELNAKTSETSAATSANTATTQAYNASKSATAAKISETNAKVSETQAGTYAGNSKASADAAKLSETNAASSASSASDSEAGAATQASNASKSATEASSSASAAKVSETNAKTSETRSASSASSASTSASNAKTSETNAKASETNASSSETTAKSWAVATTSPDGATDADSNTGKTQSSRSWALASKASAESASSSASTATTQASSATASAKSASESATSASGSATNAESSATAAKNSASAAATSATNASNSETQASKYKTSASDSATAAASSATSASASATNAKASMNTANTAASSASTSETSASTSASNAAKAEVAAKTAQAAAEKARDDANSAVNKLTGAMKYAGQVDNYSDLESYTKNKGDVWNIVNADPTHGIKAGDNVAWNGTGWDNLSGTVDLSIYAEKADYQKTITSATADGATITFNHKDGTTSTATVNNVASATAATNDAKGQKIDTTYEKVTDASNVHTSLQNSINSLSTSKQDKLTFDLTPTAGSNNPVTSNGIKTSLDGKPSNTGAGASGTWGIDITGTATNADKLDGYHENSFLRYRGYAYTNEEATLWNQIGIKEYRSALPEGVSNTYNYGAVVSLPSQSFRLDIWYNDYSSTTIGNGLLYRSGYEQDKRPWVRLLDSVNYNKYAPTKTGEGASGTWDINITGNATKDGNGNVIADTYLKKAGDTATGAIVAPSFQTGTADANYFQCKKFRGEGNADTYYHAVDFGYSDHDRVDFYEYGGVWNFWQNTSSTKGGTLVGSIKPTGWNGNVVGNVTGNVTGNANTATKATQDAAGNVITTTYATKAEIPTVPTKVSSFTNDAGYLTTHQDLSGYQTKLTFDTTPTANSTNPVTSSGIKTALDGKPSNTGAGASGTWNIGISGNAATATKATGDSDGNNIKDTYATKADISNEVTTKNLNSANLTVTGPTSVPTANADNNSKTIANTAYVDAAINAAVTSVTKTLSDNMHAQYPVGSYIYSDKENNPATYLPYMSDTTWVQTAAGRVLIGAGTADSGTVYTAGDTGGEEKHKITMSELPVTNISVSGTTSSAGAHTHAIRSPAGKAEDGSGLGRGYMMDRVNTYYTESAGAHTHTFTGTGRFGGDASHNNMQPYSIVYIFKRTT